MPIYSKIVTATIDGSYGPSLPMQPATKQYVDNTAASVVPVKGIEYFRYLDGDNPSGRASMMMSLNNRC